jgi:hypothetical protein
MAVVYLARQIDLDRSVALKELSSFHADTPEAAERFLRESRLAGSLSHPNIVTVHEYFEHDGIPYIAMEFVPLGSLRPFVGTLTLAKLAGVLEGVLAGLTHAEHAGIVHRDLKPENIMVTAEGRVKIADFGIAKASQTAGMTAALTATGAAVGTPTYMAPEQAMAQPVGPWTDLYSVGIMAYEQVTGRPPFYGAESPMVMLMRHVNEPVPPAITVIPEIDPALSDWIDQLLIKDTAARTRSPEAAWEALEEIVIRLLGPRWRRAARLVETAAVTDTPQPLTPAPFQTKPVETPPAQPAAAESGFVTFDPQGSTPYPSASSPAGTPAPAAPPADPAGPPAAPAIETQGTAVPPAGVPDAETPPAGAEPDPGTSFITVAGTPAATAGTPVEPVLEPATPAPLPPETVAPSPPPPESVAPSPPPESVAPSPPPPPETVAASVPPAETVSPPRAPAPEAAVGARGRGGGPGDVTGTRTTVPEPRGGDTQSVPLTETVPSAAGPGGDRRGRPGPRRGRLLGAGLVVVVAIVAVVVLASGGGGNHTPSPATTGGQTTSTAAQNTTGQTTGHSTIKPTLGPSAPALADIHSSSGPGGTTLRGPIALTTGGTPRGLVVVGRDAWVLDSGHNLIVNVTETGSELRVHVGTDPQGVAFDREGGRLWVANRGSNDVTELDRFGKVLRKSIGVGAQPTAVATGVNAVWVADSGDGTITRIDPQSGATKRIAVGGTPTAVITAFGRVWVAKSDRSITVLSPSGDVNGTVPTLPGAGEPIGLAASNGLWVVRAAAGGAGKLSKVDPRINVAVRQTPPYQYVVHADSPSVGAEPLDIDALGAGLSDNTIWVVSGSDHTLFRVGTNGTTNDKVLTKLSVGNSPDAVAVYSNVVWVADAGGKALYEVTYGG